MVTASGAETSEQFEFLHSIGCDRIQGPHIADVLSAGQLLDFMSNDTLDELTTTLQAPIASPKEQAPPSKIPGAPRATR
jgi:EAL domain-containing protein (putative c-di-GMP-specific phosphodiesterase class I)